MKKKKNLEFKALKLKYFSLNPRSKFKHDPYAQASRAAMVAYAENIREENRLLADDLLAWASFEHKNDQSIGKCKNETETEADHVCDEFVCAIEIRRIEND